ncbi:hypothetical protein SDC9_164362 [bioreactor metagenome]|uniref:Uncharacterized protein n=1 Tax=bioreactor metagenome TaxID=1076179 RepID=A0A645FYM8_9ZZZZ
MAHEDDERVAARGIRVAEGFGEHWIGVQQRKQIAQEKGVVGIGLRQLGDPMPQHPQGPGQIVDLGVRDAHLLAPFREQRAHDLGLRREPVVQVARADPGLLGDPVRRDRTDPVLGEQAPGGLQDRLTTRRGPLRHASPGSTRGRGSINHGHSIALLE